MAGLNIKDASSNWKSILSNDATSIKLNNPNFKEDNVSDALSRLRLDNVGLKQNIAYLYQNGTLGGGGGGGGADIGKITSTTIPSNGSYAYFGKNEQVNINFRIEYRKLEYYDVTIKISGTNKSYKGTVKANESVTWNAGTFVDQGEYFVEISAVNKDFEQLDYLTGYIVIGAVELSSTFLESNIYSPARPINISYFINCKLNDPITLFYDYGDGEQKIENVPANVQGQITIGPLPAKIYNFSMYAKSGDKVSNILYYTIKVANTESVFITIPNYAQKEYVKGNPINLPYVISTIGAESYKITGKLYSKDSVLLQTINAIGEIGVTNIITINTSSLNIGKYDFKLYGESVDNPDKHTEEDAIIEINLVQEENFNIWGTAGEGQATLIGDFNARSSNSSDKIWNNTIKNDRNVKIDLYNTNGYVSGFLPFKNSLSLRGESYGILNYKPFENNMMVEDFAISFLYKLENNGDPNACVVSCGEYSTNTGLLNYGFEITASQINVRTVNNSVTATTGEDSWQECCIVFERINEQFTHTGADNPVIYANYFIKVYINGVISKSNFVNIDNAYPLPFNNIYLGCRANTVAGNTILSNFSNCEIKNIRIYEIRLSPEQIVYNYISNEYWQNPIYEYDITGKNIIGIKGYDIQKQRKLRELNAFDDNGKFKFNLADESTCPLPRLRISFYDDQTGAEFFKYTRTTSWKDGTNDFNKKFRCKISYYNKYDGLQFVEIDGYISLQGTSSGEYLSKNYEIYFGSDESVFPAKPILFTPKEDWLPENSFTIKTNMMDSSHANNIGSGHIINNQLYKSLLPPMINTASNPNPYADKVKYTLEGFPVHVGITFTGTKENYMGVHTFNMGRKSFYNLGLKAFKDLTFKNPNKPVGLVESYSENTSGIYGQSVAFEITTSNNLGSPAFRQYSDQWMTYFAQQFPEDERSYLPNTTLKRYMQNSVKDVALSTQASGIPQLNLDGTPTLDNQGNVIYLPTDGKAFEDITEMDREFMCDYLLTAYMLGMSDSLGKNMMIKSWGREEGDNPDHFHWYPTFYDMDTCLGVSNDGQLDFLRCGPGMDISSYKDGKFESGSEVYIEGTGDNKTYIGLGYGTYNLSNSLLWIQFMKDHRYRPGSRAVNMINRYKELRLPAQGKPEGIFSAKNIFKSYQDIINNIGASFYNEDAKIKYLQLEEVTDDLGKPIGATYKYIKNFLNGKREAYTKQWITQRIKYLDTIFNLSDVMVPDNTVSKNIALRFNTGTSQQVSPKLILKTYSPMFPTMFWSGLDTGSLTSKYLTGDTLSGKTGEGIFAGQVTASNQSSLLTNAPDIEYIKNLKECNPSRLELAEATSLRELDLAGRNSIEYLDVQTCKSLRILNLKDCINLSGVDKQLNVAGCESLEYVDISGTKIEKVVLSDGDTPKVVLQNFKANRCNITSLNFKGQSYLKNIELNDCKSLTDLTFDGCTALEHLNCSNFYINSITLKDCTSLKSIDLSNCNRLVNVSISNCPLLEDINLSNSVSRENIDGAAINLTGAYNLKRLYLNTSNIKKVTLYKDITSLETVDFGNCVISQTTFGNTDSVTDAGEPLIDFSRQGNMKNVTFARNTEVRNIIIPHLYLDNAIGSFEGCINLRNLTSTIHLKGSIQSTFSGCTRLIFSGINYIDNGITNADIIFQSCDRLTYDDLLKFINNSTSVESYINLCANCNLTKVGLIENIFERHTNLKYLNNAFMGCRNLMITLKSDFFASCSKVLRTDRMFSSSGLAGIPSDILSPLIELVNCDEMFANSSLTGTLSGEEIFKHNTKVDKLDGVFKGCKSLKISLPGGIDPNVVDVPGEGTAVLFKNNTKITSVNKCFEGVTILGKINVNTFINNKALEDISNAFADTKVFAKLNNLGELFTPIAQLKYALGFMKNTNIVGHIPPRFFANAPTLIDISGFFAGTSLSTGAGNEYAFEGDILEENVNLESINELFKGCKELRGKIPRNVFKKLKKLRKFSGLFDGCLNLTGEIPYDLFLIDEERPTPGLVENKLLAVFDASGKSNSDVDKNSWVSTNKQHTINLINFNFDINDGWHNNGLKFNNSKNVCEFSSFIVQKYYNASIVMVVNKTNSTDNIIMFNGNNNNPDDTSYNAFNGYVNGLNVGLNNVLDDKSNNLFEISNNRDTVYSFVLNAVGGKNELYMDGVFKGSVDISDGQGDYINESLSFGNAKTKYVSDSGIYDYENSGEFVIKKILIYKNALNAYENDQIYQSVATIPLIPYESYRQLDVNQVPSTPGQITPNSKPEDNIINVFKDCTGLMFNIGSNNFNKFFRGLKKAISLDGFFHNCTSITGFMPKDLLADMKMLKSASNMFRGCSLIKDYVNYDGPVPEYYFVDSTFFKDCNAIENLSGFFAEWNLDQAKIPDNLFSNLKELRTVSYIFFRTNLPKGIPENLFQYNHNLEDISYFAAEAQFNKNSISANMFLPYDIIDKLEIGNKLNNVSSAFASAKFLYGYPIEFWQKEWKDRLKNNYSRCYYECVYLTGYSEIPNDLK